MAVWHTSDHEIVLGDTVSYVVGEWSSFERSTDVELVNQTK
jgi:hypothetical protein